MFPEAIDKLEKAKGYEFKDKKILKLKLFSIFIFQFVLIFHNKNYQVVYYYNIQNFLIILH